MTSRSGGWNSFLVAMVQLFFLFFPSNGTAEGQFFLRGTVTDSVTGDPLVAANIRILGTSKGTITNDQGAYVLSLESGTQSVVYSYVGYLPETLQVAISGDLIHDVPLTPSPVRLAEVIALAEDPALEIIRKAIATKRTWMDKLNTYIFDAVTRQVLRRDTAIASITESYTTGFMKTGDTLREVIRQRRQTENVPMNENLAAVRRIVNFNDDEVTLFSFRTNNRVSSFTLVGPTAPDALDNYDYTLLKTARVSGFEVYTIRMTPKSRLKPLFDGIITIAEGTFAIMGVDVRPNESFTLPFVKELSLRYRQQFALYDSLFWMPTDIRIDGEFSISFVGISLPRIGFNAVSSIYDYKINLPLPDSILQQRRLTVDSSAARCDSTFWRTHEVVPLTAEEQSAYEKLDSTQTLEKQFQPGGPLAVLTHDETESLLSHLDFHFSRVEGFYLGGNGWIPIPVRTLRLEGSAGAGFSDQRIKYGVRATWYADSTHRFGFGADAYNRVDHVPDGNFYGSLAISFMALIDKNDYRDYYLAKGYRFFTAVQPTKSLHATLSFTSEQEYSLESQTSYSLFSRSIPYRINPPITDGLLRSVSLDVRFGEEASAFDIVSRNAVEFSIEHSSPSIAKSEFDYTRYHGLVLWNIPTFARSFLFPPTLRIRVSAGLGMRDLPPQRYFSIDSRASGYSPFGVLHGVEGKEFNGNRFVMINLEHNFRSVPFLLLNLPFLYRNSIEFIVHGSIAQTWIDSRSASDGWYKEAGVGISRIFDILRMDLTYRFIEPKRFFVTVSVATLF